MPDNPSQRVEQNKAVVRHYIEELWERRNYSIIDELFTENVTSHLLPSSSHGREEIKQNVAAILTAFPDARLIVDDLSGTGDKVILDWKLCGNHQGVFYGIQPTDKQVTIRGVTTIALVEGLIAEILPEVDVSGFLQQLGRLPDMEA